jgi:tetratricopeptide (TPR) repeat protein
VFLGTPHRGAELADTLFRLGRYLGISPSARDLQTHNGLLKNLNVWYAGRARDLGVATHCFYEMQPTAVGMIVPQDSGDIDVRGIPSYPVGANHGEICKPSRSDHWLCGYLAMVVREAMGAIVVPRQLPEDPSHFVGREAELQTVIAGLLGGDSKAPIAAINEMGGVGKSAFAIKAARTLAPKVPDGQIYVELGGVSERPLSALDAIAAVLRAFDREAAALANEQDAIGDYRRALEGKQVLVLLDNAKDAGVVAPLVQHRAPGCLLIVTSRGAMPFPDITRILLEELQPDEAIRLVRDLLGPERAGPDELAVLAERCGYLPLALHAAAGVLTGHATLPTATYLAALAKERERLPRLRVKGLSNLDVAAVLSFSARQLDEDDHALAVRWSELAVFPTTFDAAAAAAVWQTETTLAELALHDLVARSMVRFEPTTQRFGLHDLMRELAGSGLVDGVDLDEAAARHAWYYCYVLAIAGELFLKSDKGVIAGLAVYDLEQRNIAVGQARARARANRSGEMAEICDAFGDTRGAAYLLGLRMHPRERIAWFDAKLNAARQLGHRPGEGFALGELGIAYRHLGEARRAIAYCEQALPVLRELGDRRAEGSVLCVLGNAYGDVGEPRWANEYHGQALAISREIGDQRGEGAALGNLGVAHLQLGEAPRAIEYFELQLQIARKIGDLPSESNALGNLGVAYGELGEPQRAIEYFEQHLRIVREIGHRRAEGRPLSNLGNVYAALGELRRAIEYYEQSLKLARELDDKPGEANALHNWALALEELGKPTEALEKAEAALATYAQIKHPNADEARALVERLRGH